MPGYFKQPELSAMAFDKDGYYMTGGALRFVDLAAPYLGLMYDGHVMEDFKRSSGTRISVGSLRLSSIERTALAQDSAVAGHGQDEICLLVFPNVGACRQLAGLPKHASISDVLAHPSVKRHLRMALEVGRQAGTKSSTYAVRDADGACSIGRRPGNYRQRLLEPGAVSKNRATLGQRLYSPSAYPGVISL